MNKIKNHYKNLVKIIILIMPVIVVALLAICAPFMQDDWAWGTSVGVQRLQEFFANYNGRYFGNLLVYALTRSKVLWIISVPLAVLILSVAIQRVTGCIRLVVYLAAPSMLLMMRIQMLRQIIVWRSGFSNYFPPILIAVIYVALISNIFGDKPPKYNKYLPVLTFILGICGALFMEHVTMYSFLLGIAVIVYSKVRFKKVYSPFVLYLVGAVSGAAIMFSNSAYINILLGRDKSNYRTVGGTSLADTLMTNGNIISMWFIEYNPAIVSVIFVLIAVLTGYFIKNKQLSKKSLVTVSATLFFELCYIVLIWVLYSTDGKALYGQKYDLIRFILAVCAYGGFVLLCAILPFEREVKEKLLFSFLSAGALCVPLFLTTPVSPRCLFPSYVMMSLAVCILTSSVISRLGKKISLFVSVSLLIAFTCCSVYYCTAYSNVHQYESYRNDYVKTQIAQDNKSIDVPVYPKDMRRFASGDYKKGTVWEKRFADFYGVSGDDVIMSQSKPLTDNWSKME